MTMREGIGRCVLGECRVHICSLGTRVESAAPGGYLACVRRRSAFALLLIAGLGRCRGWPPCRLLSRRVCLLGRTEGV